MAEKRTMTTTFEPTLDVYRILAGKPTEYIVVNPVTVEARFKSGEVRRYPQEIRERVVRCRDCVKSEHRGRRSYCKAPMGHVGYAEGCDDDFCSYGAPRETVE